MKIKFHFKNDLLKKQRKTFTWTDLFDGNSTKVIKLKLYIEFLFLYYKDKIPPKFKVYIKCSCDNFVSKMFCFFFFYK